MAQVMEPTLWQSSAFEQPMEFLGHSCPVEGCSDRSCEDKPSVVPALARLFSLELLTAAVFAQSLADHRRHRQCPPAALGLRLNQLGRSVDPLQLFSDAHVSKLDVDVLPCESQSLALAEPHRQRD